MRALLSSLLILISVSLLAQAEPDTRDFRSPLDIPLILAGTFGELRSNHFHSGLDLKTQQREGLPVYAIGPGTVSRIKISHWGYGKALYIAHPNGYTSVYAHLQKFSPEIEAYVKKAQYDQRSYEIELFPEHGKLLVDQGEVIAFSGNTGGSSGPHLHFEIRNSTTEHPINPLLFGYEVRDATEPTLLEAYAYPLSQTSQVSGSTERIKLNIRRQADGTYVSDTLSVIGDIGFGVHTYDRQDMAANKNGPYAIKQLVDGKLYTDIVFDRFSFGESRLINTLIDYEHFGQTYDRVQRLFRAPGNRLSLFETPENDGKVSVQSGSTKTVEIVISDLKENKTLLRIPLQGKRLPQQNKTSKRGGDHYVLAARPNTFEMEGAKVFFPAQTFYEDFALRLEMKEGKFTIHDNTVPAHRRFTLSFDVDHLPEEERRQWFIARLDKRGRPSFVKTYRRGNIFSARTRNLGTYTLERDTTAPKIRPKNFKARQWLTNYRYLRLHISDDLSGISSYKASLNGEWILMEYEPKTNTLTYDFSDNVSSTSQNELRVELLDNAGNATEYTVTFFRKPGS